MPGICGLISAFNVHINRKMKEEQLENENLFYKEQDEKDQLSNSFNEQLFAEYQSIIY